MTTAASQPARLEPDACWRLLRLADVGRLAVIVGEGPDIFPVNYAVDQASVVLRTAPGSKLAAAVGGSPVAFEADGYDQESGEAWSVVVKGRAEEVHGFAQLLDTTYLPVFPWQGSTKSHFVRILADEVTGRRFPRVDPSFWNSSGPRSRHRLRRSTR